jgi:hypothetical protein
MMMLEIGDFKIRSKNLICVVKDFGQTDLYYLSPLTLHKLSPLSYVSLLFFNTYKKKIIEL